VAAVVAIAAVVVDDPEFCSDGGISIVVEARGCSCNMAFSGSGSGTVSISDKPQLVGVLLPGLLKVFNTAVRQWVSQHPQ
jgi:hypothetical protein